MTWQSLGAITPIEKQFLDYSATTQAPDTPLMPLPYRVTGLNVDPLDADKFFALMRFKAVGDVYSRSLVIRPSAESQVVSVQIPPEVTVYPFTWVPQVQLIYLKRPLRPVGVNWAIRIDEFVSDSASIALQTLRFLY